VYRWSRSLSTRRPLIGYRASVGEIGRTQEQRGLEPRSAEEHRQPLADIDAQNADLGATAGAAPGGRRRPDRRLGERSL